MAIPVARVHLKMAHAALPALLPTPPKWNMLPAPLLPTSCVAAILPNKPPLAKPSRADADERWDARKIKPASAEPSASSASTLRSADGVVSSTAGHGSFHSQRKNATSPPPMSGRADAMERWDAHKKAAASPASSSSSSSSSAKWTSSRASAAERWDMHKKSCLPQAKLLDDGESSSTGSNGIDMEEEDEEEEIVWKPRALYAGPGFVVAAPESSMLPMPTAFLVPVA